MPSPSINLAKLRGIGWSIWDPIGLLPAGERWESDEYRAFADEYDSYLLAAADMLRRGVTDAEVVRYLVRAEAEHMGLGKRDDINSRAWSVVGAIRSCENL